MLRNPNLSIYGTAYANNVYDIETRTIIPQANTTDVQMVLSCYTDASKEYKVSETSWSLTGLTTDPALLLPSLYQTELIAQHGSEMLDGTALDDFIVVS